MVLLSTLTYRNLSVMAFRGPPRTSQVLLSLILTIGWLAAACTTAVAPSDTTATGGKQDVPEEVPQATVDLLSTVPAEDSTLPLEDSQFTFTLRFDRPVTMTSGTLSARADGHDTTFDWATVASHLEDEDAAVTVNLPAELAGNATYTFSLDGGLEAHDGTAFDLTNLSLRFNTPVGLAGPVQNLSTEVGDAATEIRFDPPTLDGGSDLTGFTVEQRAANGEWTQVDTSELGVDNPGPHVINIDHPFAGGLYDVRISAINASGAGIASLVTINPSPIPTAPALALSPGEERIKLTLGAPAYLGSDTAPSIVVEQRANESDPWTTADTVLTQLGQDAIELELRNLNPGEAVYLRAAYETPNGVGAFASGTATPYGAPQPVQNLFLDATDGGLDIHFDAPSNTGGAPIQLYEISHGPDASTSGGTVTSTDTHVVLNGLTNGETHHVQVVAVNDLGYESASATASTVIHPRAYSLAGDEANRRLGRQVTISGNHMAAVSRGNNGYAQLDFYSFDGGWTKTKTFDVNALVEAADAQAFSSLNFVLKQNTHHIDISLDGEWLALGLPDVRYEFTAPTYSWSSDRVGLVLILGYDDVAGWTFDPTRQIWNNTDGIEWLFGWDVELSDTRLAVTAPLAGAPSGIGKVVLYDFDRQNGVTNSPTTLNVPPATPNANDGAFGETVVIDGDRVAIGSYLVDAPPNHAFLFIDAGGWSHEFTTDALAPFSETFFDDAVEFEIGVALAGDYLAVSEPTANDFDGRVTLYRNTGVAWIEQATLTSNSNSEYFGYQLGFADGYLIVTGHSRNTLNPTSQVHCLDLASDPSGTISLGAVAGLAYVSADVMSLDTNGAQMVLGLPFSDTAGQNAGMVAVIPDASRVCDF